MACLFVALMLVARITRELGIGSGQSAHGSHSATGTVDSEALASTAERPAVPRTGRPGGHRAQR